MAFTTLYENTYTISNSEKSLTTGSAYSGSSVQSTDADLWIYLDTSSMAANDRGLIRVYEKVLSSGSAQVVYEYSIAKGFVTPINVGAIGNGWDVVAIRIAGADFNLSFSLRDQTSGGLDAAATRAAIGLASANLDTQLSTIDTVVDGIKAKTDNLPTDPADASDIASSFTTVNTKLDTIDDFLDTEMAAVKVVTDKLDTALVLDGSVYQYTANALELAPSGGLDAAGVRDAVGLASANLDTQLSTIDTVVDAVKVKTDRLTFNAQDHVAANVHQIQATPISDIQSGLATQATAIEIKDKTDQLTFTSGNVNANTKAMNDATVLGNGTEANLWRGA